MVAGTLAAFLSITALISSGGIDATSIGVPGVGGDGGAVEIQRSQPPPRERSKQHTAATAALTTLPAFPAGLVFATAAESPAADDDGRHSRRDRADAGRGRHAPATPGGGGPPSVPVAPPPPPAPGGTSPAPAQGPGGTSPGPPESSGGISAPPVAGSGGFAPGPGAP
jgi:hypothetical protein